MKVQHDTDKVHIRWSDGHHSEYDLSWLGERSFEPQNQTSHEEDIKRKQHHRSEKGFIKRLKFDDVSIDFKFI